MQLIPAVRIEGNLAISNETGSSWSTIRPEQFAAKLTLVNSSLGGQLVPTIKLAKRLIASLPQAVPLKGYHIESLAIEAFEDYDGMRTPKEMISRFFKEAALSASADPRLQWAVDVT